ncbi:MAG: DUF3379 family protein [Gammaproteobacteria bacterium]|nr:DUF3379 family protein [Gammaproteobacteria bacterium]
MNCLEFRRQIDTDPNCPDPEFLRHRLSCRECAALAARAASFQNALNDAVRFETPENLASRILLKQSFSGADTGVSRRRVMAIAAGVTLAVGAGAVAHLFLFRQSDLAQEVFALIRAAPDALAPGSPLAASSVAEALAPVGLALKRELSGVTFASQCILRNRLAGHLVIQGSVAPVTVFVIPGRVVAGPESIRSDSLRGELLPHESGTLAIVGARGEPLDQVRERVRSAITFRNA